MSGLNLLNSLHCHHILHHDLLTQVSSWSAPESVSVVLLSRAVLSLSSAFCLLLIPLICFPFSGVGY
jgi:hypothetical protein